MRKALRAGNRHAPDETREEQESKRQPREASSSHSLPRVRNELSRKSGGQRRAPRSDHASGDKMFITVVVNHDDLIRLRPCAFESGISHVTAFVPAVPHGHAFEFRDRCGQDSRRKSAAFSKGLARVALPAASGDRGNGASTPPCGDLLRDHGLFPVVSIRRPDTLTVNGEARATGLDVRTAIA